MSEVTFYVRLKLYISFTISNVMSFKYDCSKWTISLDVNVTSRLREMRKNSCFFATTNFHFRTKKKDLQQNLPRWMTGKNTKLYVTISFSALFSKSNNQFQNSHFTFHFASVVVIHTNHNKLHINNNRNISWEFNTKLFILLQKHK